MRSLFGKVSLLMGTGILATLGARAEMPRTLDVALTYDASQANIVPGNNFWMQGGSVQVHARFWHGLGVVADPSLEERPPNSMLVRTLPEWFNSVGTCAWNGPACFV